MAVSRTKGKVVGSQAWLAERLDVTPGRVSQLIRSDGWPFGPGPWTPAQVPAIKAHMAERRANANRTGGQVKTAEVDPADPLSEIRNLSPVNKAKLQLIVERAAKLKLEREMLLGGYLKKEDVERGRVERVQAVRGELANVRLLALRMEGKELRERETILEEWARETCRKFEQGGD